MTIRAYHQSRGDEQRNICLIPVSAHGTNLPCIWLNNTVTKTMENGRYRGRRRREKHYNIRPLSCLMVTYPSTHGVLKVLLGGSNHQHDNGLVIWMVQIWMHNDLLQATIKWCYLNLHKTSFAIPLVVTVDQFVNEKLVPFYQATISSGRWRKAIHCHFCLMVQLYVSWLRIHCMLGSDTMLPTRYSKCKLYESTFRVSIIHFVFWEKGRANNEMILL
jgi:glycine dehydrogenase